MKKLTTLLSVVMMTLGLCAGTAQAQQFTAATGAKAGTYSKMFGELSVQCQQEVGTPFVERQTAGSVENLDLILTNQAPAGFVQVDNLFFRAKTDDLSKLKTLFSLHPEEVHIIAKSAPRMTGGLMGVGAKETPFSALANLRGLKVGAWGGSVVTAQVIRLQSEVPYNVSEFADRPAAMAALNAGIIDAVLAVGGSPLDWVGALGRNYKLLSIGQAEAEKLKSVYRPARMSYSALGQSGIPTVSTEAALVVRDYKGADTKKMLLAVRNCFATHLDDLAEKPGNHPKWADIKLDVPAKWPLYGEAK